MNGPGMQPPWQRPPLWRRVLQFLGLVSEPGEPGSGHPLEKWSPADLTNWGQRERLREEVIRLARRVDQLEQEVRELRRR